MVIQDARQRGTLNPGHINGPGAARVFLRAATEPHARWSEETDRILSRPDVDWRHWATYLAACGLALPLAAAVEAPALRRVAPAFFTARLADAAVRQGIGQLVQHDVLRRLAAGLRALGARGVVLKGTALALRAKEAGDAIPPRATGDLDVHVGADLGPALRRHLLELGFRGTPDARATSTHHLAPVTLDGILVEIHTRIAAPHWGLPEAEMLARARPLAAGELATLDAEGLLLHALVHCAQHGFSHGLRGAWDALAVLRVAPEVDWDRLARWVASMRAPRGFWVPAAVLARELGLPLPPEFLRQAPRDALQRDLEAVAARRLFRVAERVEALDPVSRHGLTLLMHDSVGARARYLAAVGRWALARPARPAAAGRPAVGPLRQAWRHFRQYRRAVAADQGA
jgi:hypothetical protein